MTAAADRLRQHAQKTAQPDSLLVAKGQFDYRAYDLARSRLEFLARDLALLCADMADALAEAIDGAENNLVGNSRHRTSHWRALLARLDTLTAAAGPE